MLYQLYDSQRALLSPFAEFASATSKLSNNPLSPFAHTPGDQLGDLATEIENQNFLLAHALP